MLLVLLSAQRVQTLALLSIDAMTFNRDGVKFKVSGLLKQSKPGTLLGDIELQIYSYCRRLCIVTLFQEYVGRTVDCRQTSLLFVSFVILIDFARWCILDSCT